MAKDGEDIVGATGSSQDIIKKVRKTIGISDEDWEDMDLKAASTIQLYVTDEVICNVTDEKTATGLWSRLEILYMTKSIFNKLYLKKQLYGLCMTKGSAVLEHLKFFNKVTNELLTVNLKIDEEDKTLILLSLLSEPYDHIVTTILYGKETLILKDVTSTLLSNEIKKIKSS